MVYYARAGPVLISLTRLKNKDPLSLIIFLISDRAGRWAQAVTGLGHSIIILNNDQRNYFSDSF